jgi:hypothetical protein
MPTTGTRAAGRVHKGNREARDALQGVEAVLTGQRERFVHEYPCPGTGPERWFELAVYPLKHPVAGVALVRFEVTRRHWADAFLQGLACGDHARTDRALHSLLQQGRPAADGPKGGGHGEPFSSPYARGGAFDGVQGFRSAGRSLEPPGGR